LNKPVDLALGFDEYSRNMASEKANRSTLAKDVFRVAVLFLVASGAALYSLLPYVALVFVLVFLIVPQVASETRPEIAMIDANGWLALLVHPQARELDWLRGELKQQDHGRTR